MADDWNDCAEGWDGNASVRLYAERAFASLTGKVDIREPSWKSKRVLDFGCGTGLLAEKIAPYVDELVAVDTSAGMIEVLKGKEISGLTAHHGNVLNDDFRRNKNLVSGFDLIYASSVCSFLPDYEGAVMKLASLLTRGGYFVQWDWQANDAGDFGLAAGRIRNALESAHLGSILVEPAFTTEPEEQAMTVLLGAGRS